MIGKKPGLGPDNNEATSTIGENSVLEGTFEVTGNLRVDGKFTGKLRVTETLVVGKNGLVDAKVVARNAVIAGTIKGDLNSSEKITLQSGSRLEGEMVTSRLVIEEGVSFQGSCNTSQTGGPRKTENAFNQDPQTVTDKIEKVAEQLAR
jgi:cytoskeletal protein CcmA (bactofilin family)